MKKKEKEKEKEQDEQSQEDKKHILTLEALFLQINMETNLDTIAEFGSGN